MAQEKIDKALEYGIQGSGDFFKGLLQFKKIEKRNHIMTIYLDLSGTIDFYEGILNDERTLLVIRGIHRLMIVSKIFQIRAPRMSLAFAYEGNHKTLDVIEMARKQEGNPLLKEAFRAVDPNLPEEDRRKAESAFLSLKLSDLGYTIDLTRDKTIIDKAHDFSADSFYVLSRLWFQIVKKSE